MPHVQGWAAQPSLGDPELSRKPGGITIITPSVKAGTYEGRPKATVVIPVPSPKEGSLNQVHLHFSSEKAVITRISVLYGLQEVWNSGKIEATETERFNAYTEVGIGNRGIGVAFDVEFRGGFDPKPPRIELESVGLTFVAS